MALNVIAEASAHAAEHFDEVLDVVGVASLLSDFLGLVGVAWRQIAAETVVGRRRDNALHRLLGDVGQPLHAVPDNNVDGHAPRSMLVVSGT